MAEGTLRDYFACQAMVALLTTVGEGAVYQNIAEEAYAVADTMMAQRAEP